MHFPVVLLLTVDGQRRGKNPEFKNTAQLKAPPPANGHRHVLHRLHKHQIELTAAGGLWL